MIPITKVSATGRPITSSDAVGLLLKKHGIHIPPHNDADTVKACEDVATFPAASVTVSVVTSVPDLWYAWLIVCPLPLPPSPKFQVNE